MKVRINVTFNRLFPFDHYWKFQNLTNVRGILYALSILKLEKSFFQSNLNCRFCAIAVSLTMHYFTGKIRQKKKKDRIELRRKIRRGNQQLFFFDC